MIAYKRVTHYMIHRMDPDNKIGRAVIPTLDNGETIKKMDKAHYDGIMVRCMRETGWIIICMVRVY